jgi:hypothetical protein
VVGLLLDGMVVSCMLRQIIEQQHKEAEAAEVGICATTYMG